MGYTYSLFPFFEQTDEDDDVWNMTMVCHVHVLEVERPGILKQSWERFIDLQRLRYLWVALDNYELGELEKRIEQTANTPVCS